MIPYSKILEAVLISALEQIILSSQAIIYIYIYVYVYILYICIKRFYKHFWVVLGYTNTLHNRVGRQKLIF